MSDEPRAAARAATPEASEEGGGEVCLLHRVCPACGRLHEGRLPDVCVQCGADLPD